jgi:shikimate dehydrogenase
VKLLVVGWPVGHSLSPAMMTAAIRSAGVDATYEAREIPPEDWPAALEALHAEGVDGANVTVPHKETALAAAREATATARAIGAANTLLRRADGWLADNTDGPGFLDWVRETGHEAALAREALVLGAGGSARAVVWALRSAGCPRIRVANRSPDRAARLVAELGGGPIEAEPLDPAGSPPAPAGGLVVNCTSLGLRPDDASPLPTEALSGVAAVLDLVYPDPPLACAARAGGIPAADGRGLLVAQGARSFEEWTGVPADRKAMAEAVERELARRLGG